MTKFEIGDIVKSLHDEFIVTYISKMHNGIEDRYYGKSIEDNMVMPSGAYESNLVLIEKNKVKLFNNKLLNIINN